MGRRTGRVGFPLGLVLALTTPVGGAMAGPSDASTQLQERKEDLQQAERDLTAIDRRLLELQDRIADAEARLAVAAGELARIDQDLAGAEHDLAAARRREREAAAALGRADARLEQRLARWETSRRAMQRRAADAYKYGGTMPTRLLLRSFSAPRDIHDIAVGAKTLERLASTDEAMVVRHLDEARAAADARAGVAAARSAAVEEQRIADAARDRVAALAEEQRQVLDEIEAEQEHRRAAIARLEADREATAALARQLAEQVRRLQVDLLTVFVRDAADPPFDGPTPDWARALPPAGRPWAATVEGAAARAGLDGRLVAALVWTESNFIPTAVSRAGAIGLAQLLEGTARGLGVDPYDPVQNLVGGARYLRQQFDRFARVDLALAAYNAGPGRVARAGNAIPSLVETQLYVVRVLDRWERLAGSG